MPVINGGDVSVGVGRINRCSSEIVVELGPDAKRYCANHGSVGATDGRQLLVQGGLDLPWRQDLLLPALPVYLAAEFNGGEVRVGRTEKHVAVVRGPWAVLLALDATARFPDYRSVIPSPSSSSHCGAAVTAGPEGEC